MSGAEKQKAVLGLDIASKSTACRTSPVLKPDAEAEREQFPDIEKSSYSQVDAVGYTDPNAVQHLIVKCVVVVNPFSVRTFANTAHASAKEGLRVKSDNLKQISPDKLDKMDGWQRLGDVVFDLVAKAALKQAQKAEVAHEQDH